MKYITRILQQSPLLWKALISFWGTLRTLKCHLHVLQGHILHECYIIPSLPALRSLLMVLRMYIVILNTFVPIRRDAFIPVYKVK